jgi:hypothetical protein
MAQEIPHQMVINMANMTKEGENSVRLSLTLQMLNILKTHAGPLNLANHDWVQTMLYTHPEIKKEFVDRYGEELWQKQLDHFSRTNIDKAAEKKIRAEARRIRVETELKIKELNAQSVAKNADTGQAKIELPIQEEIGYLNQSLKQLDESIAKYPEHHAPAHLYESKEKIEKRLAELSV